MNRAPAEGAAERSVTELLRDTEPGTWAMSANLKATTLKELGPNLPIGKASGSEVLRAFTFRTPSQRLDLAINEARAQPEVAGYPAREVLAALGEALESIGGVDMTALKAPARVPELIGLAFADVTYLLLYWAFLRRAFRQPRIPAAGAVWKCPDCRKRISQVRLDVGGTIVAMVDWTPAKPPRAVVALTDPYAYGELKASRFVLQPPAWGRALWDVSDVDLKVKGRIAANLGAAAVCGNEDGEGNAWARMPIVAFDDLPPWDSEPLAEAAQLLGGNLVPRTPYPCPSCKSALYLGMSLGELDTVFSKAS